MEQKEKFKGSLYTGTGGLSGEIKIKLLNYDYFFNHDMFLPLDLIKDVFYTELDTTSEVIFVTHSWFTEKSPDFINSVFKDIKQIITKTTLVFFDFSCLIENASSVNRLHSDKQLIQNLDSVNKILKRDNVKLYVDDHTSFDKGWVFFEFLTYILNHDNITPSSLLFKDIPSYFLSLMLNFQHKLHVVVNYQYYFILHPLNDVEEILVKCFKCIKFAKEKDKLYIYDMVLEQKKLMEEKLVTIFRQTMIQMPNNPINSVHEYIVESEAKLMRHVSQIEEILKHKNSKELNPPAPIFASSNSSVYKKSKVTRGPLDTPTITDGLNELLFNMRSFNPN